MSSENTGGAEMSELSCLLPRDGGSLGLGKSCFKYLFCTITPSRHPRYVQRHLVSLV